MRWLLDNALDPGTLAGGKGGHDRQVVFIIIIFSLFFSMSPTTLSSGIRVRNTDCTIDATNPFHIRLIQSVRNGLDSARVHRDVRYTRHLFLCWYKYNLQQWSTIGTLADAGKITADTLYAAINFGCLTNSSIISLPLLGLWVDLCCQLNAFFLP